MNPPDLSFFVALDRRVWQAPADAPQLLPLAPDAVLLFYRATFSRPGSPNAAAPQALHLWSLCKQRGASCVNVFSQNTVQMPEIPAPGTESA
jgi:hypothetical protein